MIRNELIKDSTIATTENENSAGTEDTQPASVSTYDFGRTTYTVKTYFNLDCKESFEDVLSRLMMREITELSA